MLLLSLLFLSLRLQWETAFTQVTQNFLGANAMDILNFISLDLWMDLDLAYNVLVGFENIYSTASLRLVSLCVGFNC